MNKTFDIEKVDNGWLLTITVGSGLTASTSRQIYSDFGKLAEAISAGLEYVR
jgi:hypothetical protein